MSALNAELELVNQAREGQMRIVKPCCGSKKVYEKPKVI